ncbi:terminase family protein [Ancylomarina subtilis]|uniref:Terminase family protein n=1 Tax=Ancylomarina subtilis TaxID=1639035 RepID=A0A4Q7VKF6_9BACT|nr:terminase family protein [Ancylomarina subtilis]RZT96614.1 terminase family protein [Ancylomarina subtilis]
MNNDIEFNPYEGLTRRQQFILYDIDKNGLRYNSIRGSRQAGKTVLLRNLTAYFAFKKPNQLGCYACPSHGQCQNIFERLIDAIPPILIVKTNNTDANRSIVFSNNTKVVFKTTNKPDSFRSYSFDFIISDEHAFTSELAWTKAIKPTINAKKNAKVIFASTPKGYNHFYKMCINGLSEKATRYSHYFLSYNDNPYYDKEDVEDARKELPDAIFRQEYLGEFIKGISEVFGDFQHLQTVKSWKEPKKELKYFFGVDWSGDGEDNTVLTIIDELGKVAFIKNIQAPTLIERVKEIGTIIKEYNAKGYSETNGLGIGATELLEEQVGYENVFRFTMSNESKQKIVSTIIRDINESNLALPTTNLCPVLDNELATYTVSRTATGKLKYEHCKDAHDDHVDALLMANYARHELTATGVSTYSVYDAYEDYSYDEYEDYY